MREVRLPARARTHAPSAAATAAVRSKKRKSPNADETLRMPLGVGQGAELAEDVGEVGIQWLP
jgi:hypothetical protein